MWLRRNSRLPGAGEQRRRAGGEAGGGAELGSVPAAVANRAAALLRGGMSSAHAVRAVGAEIESPETRALIADVDRGMTVGTALSQLDGPEWRVLAAAWLLAEESGAALAPALDRIAAALHSISEADHRRSVLLAGPKMTATLVGWLPLASVAVSFLLGFNPLPLFLTPMGAALLVIGLVLQIVGARWSAALTRSVEREDRVAGLECELMWVALAGGAPPSLALRRVADAVSVTRAEWVTFDSLRAGRPLSRVLEVAADAGVPASAMLLDEASHIRARGHAAIEREAERLGIRILIPLACCQLPAFIVIGVLPVVVTLLGDVLPR